jgi:hypothetical protein
LRELHGYGCRTLVHIEPYPTPNIIEQDLRELLDTVDFADEIWLGSWNYNNLAKQYPGYRVFYEEQLAILSSFLADRQSP